jgi:type IV fimbrial biogenesis protein FimT
MQQRSDSKKKQRNLGGQLGLPQPGKCIKMTNRFGFSVMELMVTIAIIGVLAAIAIPNVIAWRNNAQFNASVREVKSTIEGTRMSAIRTNLLANVIFNGANSFGTQNRAIVAGVVAPRAVVTHQLPPGITVNSNFPGNQLVFNNRGMLNPPTGTVTIQNAAGMCQQIVVSIVGSSRIDRCP